MRACIARGMAGKQPTAALHASALSLEYRLAELAEALHGCIRVKHAPVPMTHM